MIVDRLFDSLFFTLTRLLWDLSHSVDNSEKTAATRSSSTEGRIRVRFFL